jgi:hypothetical protein
MLNQKILLILICIGISVSSFSLENIYGHGLGYEVLPPVMLGDKEVALEVTSAQYADPESPDRQITLSLFETTSTITVREVTYHITAYKGNDFLFEDTFQSDNGIFTMNFIPTASGEIQLQEETEGSFFDSLVGMQKDIISINGPVFNSGGLYKFDVEILTADSYSDELEEPILYNVGLSIPDRTYYDIEDVNFGSQEVNIITYYDQIENFQYDQKTNSMSFSMPFDWTENNINQTSVVHEEVVISKTFGDLMVESLSVYVNGVKIPDYSITLDGFSEHTRIIHVVINQKDLLDLHRNYEMLDEMEFLIKPSDENLPLSTITGNGQFRIKMNWEPHEIKSGSELTVSFDIMDVFLKGKPVSVSYEISVLHEEDEIFRTSGISTDSREEHNVFSFFVPEDISEPITVQFDNLNGNSLAKVGLPIVVNRINDSSERQIANEISIPDWVRNSAGWWASNQIPDSDFASGIEYMIKEGIIKVTLTNNGQNTENAIIPDWVRNNAGWWSERLISDEEFANGLQYLIENGIISV